MNKSVSRLQPLDALRGIAALLVIIFHFNMRYSILVNFTNIGSTAVDLFFIISGFAIVYSIQDGKTSLQFLISRVSRLYPAYWAAATVTFICMILHYSIQSNFDASVRWIIKEYLINITMFQTAFKVYDLDGSYWTLYVEWNFYLLIACFIYLNKIDKLYLTGGLLLFFSFLYCLFSKLSYFTPCDSLKIFMTLLCHWGFFYSGIIFFSIWSRGLNNYDLLLLLFTFATCIISFGVGGRSYDYVNYRCYCFTTFCYFTIFILVSFNKLNFISNRITMYLGKISYPLYLVHQFIGSEFLIPALVKTNLIPILVAQLIALLTCIGVAHLITYHIEKPYDKLLKRFLTDLNLGAR